MPLQELMFYGEAIGRGRKGYPKSYNSRYFSQDINKQFDKMNKNGGCNVILKEEILKG